MATKERAAHKAVTEAREQLEQIQTHLHSTDDEPEKRGPGRPPKAPVSLEQAEQALDNSGITVNKNTIPFETRSPFQASGIRLGTPAVTTRGMKEPQMAAIADMISEVLFDIKNLDTLGKVRQRVRELTASFSLPY